MDDENIRSSHQDGRANYYSGQLFNPGRIHGQSVQVHLGDIHYATEGQHIRPSTEWQARPSLDHAASYADHLYIVPKNSSFRFMGCHLESRQIEQFFHLPLSPTVGLDTR